MNIDQFDSIFDVENMHQVNKDGDVCWWNHDVCRLTNSTQIGPEIVNHALFELGQCLVRGLILWRNLEQLVAANGRVKRMQMKIILNIECKLNLFRI